MSCGNPHEVDCGKVLDEVYLYLDGELGSEARAQVRQHLDECGPCLRKYGIEQDVKALVARCCGHESAPATLRDRVLARIRTIRVDATDGATEIALTDLEVRAE